MKEFFWRKYFGEQMRTRERINNLIFYFQPTKNFPFHLWFPGINKKRRTKTGILLTNFPAVLFFLFAE
jgi:hypothetical protein